MKCCREPMYGQCFRCGGSLTSDHRCPDQHKPMSKKSVRILRKIVREAQAHLSVTERNL